MNALTTTTTIASGLVALLAVYAAAWKVRTALSERRYRRRQRTRAARATEDQAWLLHRDAEATLARRLGFARSGGELL